MSNVELYGKHVSNCTGPYAMTAVKILIIIRLVQAVPLAILTGVKNHSLARWRSPTIVRTIRLIPAGGTKAMGDLAT